MNDKLSINIKIDGRVYPLKIDRNEEETYRKAAKIINETVLQYKKRYATHDPQDYLAMAAFQFALKTLQLEEKADLSPFVEAVRQLDEQLGDYLLSNE